MQTCSTRPIASFRSPVRKITIEISRKQKANVDDTISGSTNHFFRQKQNVHAHTMHTAYMMPTHCNMMASTTPANIMRSLSGTVYKR